MGQLIHVDFTMGRRCRGPVPPRPVPDVGDVVLGAKRLRRAIKKAQITPEVELSVRSKRSPTVIRPHTITVTVRGFAGQAFNPEWLDWAIMDDTKHTPKPPTDVLAPYTPAFEAVLRLLRTIGGLNPGDYEVQVVLDAQLYARELAQRQRARQLYGVTSP